MAMWTGLGDNMELFWAVLSHLGAQRSHHQHEGASNGLGSKGLLKAMRPGTWEAWNNQDEKIQAHKPNFQIGHVLPKFPGLGNGN
jgi:hypothetical protein